MKFGVLPCALSALLEGSQSKCSFFTQIVAQCTNRNTHEQLLSPPERRNLLPQ